MSAHKFTDDDVIKTLKNAKYKVDGVVTRGFYLSPETFNAVVDLIGRQEAEIERLNTVHADMTESLRLASEANKDMQAEVKSLEAEIDKQYDQAEADILGNMADGGTSCHWCIEKHRNNAIKEFAERLRKRARMPLGTLYGTMVYLKDIDTLVKEMTEEAEL